MTTSEAVQTVVKVMAPYIGDTMARSATGKLGGGLNIFLGRDKSASVVAEARQALAARSLGEAHLDPFVHATFVLAYGLIAGGAHRQRRLLES